MQYQAEVNNSVQAKNNRSLQVGGAQRPVCALLRLIGLPLLVWATLAPTSSQAQNFAYVANEASNSVSVIDTSNNSVVAVVPVGSFPESVGVTPDGARAYVANLLSDSVSVIDTSKNAVSASVQLPAGSYPAAVVISHDGTSAYVANYGTNSVAVIGIPGNSVVATISVAPVGTLAGPWGAGLTPDGTRLYVTEYDSSQVSVIDTSRRTVVATTALPTGSLPSSVAITPNGARAYVAGSGAGTVLVIDTSTNTLINKISDPSLSGPYGIAIAPDGKHVYASDSSSTLVSVIDTATNTVVGSIGNLSAPFGESITLDGARLYVANYASSGTVSVIDTSSNRVVVPVTVGSYPIGVAVKATAACSTCGTFPFSSFWVKLEVDRRSEQAEEHDHHEGRDGRGPRGDTRGSGFELKGAFSPAAGAPSTGIDPVTQPVTLQVGDFSITIPKGSFRRTPRGKFVYEGIVNGVRLEAQIAAVGINEAGLNYAFHVEAKPVSLTGVPGTLTVQLQVGNNVGKTTVRAGYEGGETETARKNGDRD